MKLKITAIGLFGIGVLCSSKTAGAANNDPLILYTLVLIILGGLIGFPYLMTALKNRLSKKKSIENEPMDDDSETAS